MNDIVVEKNFPYINDDDLRSLRDLFSGCRINIFLGAGFSSLISRPAGNIEDLICQAENETDEDVKNKALTFLYYLFYKNSIYSLLDFESSQDIDLTHHHEFRRRITSIFVNRGNPVLDKQFNIFTTNYDPLIEFIFDNAPIIINDGFKGRLSPVFKTENYGISYSKQALLSNRKTEIPSFNLFKLHGSLTWNRVDNDIKYENYTDKLKEFGDDNRIRKLKPGLDKALDDADLKTEVEKGEDASIKDIVNSLENILKLENPHPDDVDFENFINAYNKRFPIINPSKNKFKDTTMNLTHHEMMRIFSNELEKDNSLLVAYGYSFRDEHIVDIIKRSLVNPHLHVLIILYNRNAKDEILKEFYGENTSDRNQNLSFMCMSSDANDADNRDRLDLKLLNNILEIISK